MRLILSLLCAGLLLAVKAQDTLQFEPKLEHVTVFFQGAEIFGEAKINLAPGLHVLEFHNLTASLDPASIKVNGNDGLLIHGVNYRIKKDNVFEDARYKGLKKELDKLEEDYLSIAGENSLYDTERNILLKNSQLSNGEQSLTAAQLKAAADLYRSRLNEIRLKQSTLKQKMDELNERIEAKREELNKQIQNRSKTHVSLYVKVENERPFNENIEFSYYSPLAGWTAEYDIRVESLDKELELVYKASVFQSTGVDWTDVRLKLSTENPKQNRAKPELNPWRLPYSEQASIYEEPIQAARLKLRFYDEEGKPLPRVNFSLQTNGAYSYHGESDANGYVSIKPLEPGQYRFMAEHYGFTTLTSSIQVKAPETSQEFWMSKPSPQIIAYEAPLVNKTKSSKVTTSEDIQNMAVRDISSVAARSMSASINGNRSSGSAYYIDGVKVQGSVQVQTVSVPMMAHSTNSDISNLEYLIQKKQTILSNGEDFSTNMQLKKIPVNYIYEVVPKIDPRAYLVAEIADWEDLKLLPGSSRIYINGSYVGLSTIDVSSVKDTLRLSLGQDKGVNIQRKLGKEVKTEGLFGGNIRKTMDWEIEVRNLKSEKVSVVVFDQYPLSDKDYIEIEVLDLGGAEFNAKTGELKWLLDLEAGETKKVGFRYQVEYPEEVVITDF